MDNEEKKQKSTAKEILNFILYIVAVLLATYLIVHYVGQRTVVVGESMRETLQDGDNLVVDKISYAIHDPERFDIIVFPYEYSEETYYIKRIIGLPGETVQITADGTIMIDGKELKEDYGREVMEVRGLAAKPITLGEDEYFVLGDNRNESEDSRYEDVGLIKRKDIIGRAILRIYPFSSFGKINNKNGKD
ncbi:MAG: signal peptidase I [Lachnospiraceae bacterium]|jgi:signal peptidase I|nr:signal peptidase I [Lachnospiraceae bacterium]